VSYAQIVIVSVFICRMKWFHFRKRAGSYRVLRSSTVAMISAIKTFTRRRTICRRRSSMSTVTSALTFNTSRQGMPFGTTGVTAASALATPLFGTGVEAVTRISPTTHQERQ
jgi:hypothetical protein